MRTFFVPLFAIPSRQVLLVLFAIAIWFLLISWEYVVSLSMFGMVGLSLFQWYPEKLRWGWRQTLPQALRRLRSDPSWFAAAIPFFLVLFTAIYSSDGDYTLNRLQVKIPFLVLTFAFAGLPVGEKRTYFQLHYLLLVLMCMAAVPVVVEYVSDPSLYNDLLRQGRHLPTPSNHIRFSMVGALAFCSGLYLYQQRFVWRSQKERFLQVVMLIFLFGFLHLLAVRSGLLVLYVGILFSLARYIFLSRQWIRGGLLVFLLAAEERGLLLLGAGVLSPSASARRSVSSSRRSTAASVWRRPSTCASAAPICSPVSIIRRAWRAPIAESR